MSSTYIRVQPSCVAYVQPSSKREGADKNKGMISYQHGTQKQHKHENRKEKENRHDHMSETKRREQYMSNEKKEHRNQNNNNNNNLFPLLFPSALPDPI
jgi:hypothetical protein